MHPSDVALSSGQTALSPRSSLRQTYVVLKEQVRALEQGRGELAAHREQRLRALEKSLGNEREEAPDIDDLAPGPSVSSAGGSGRTTPS